MISIRNLTKVFKKDKEVLTNINLDINAGCTCIFGKNGAGKSVLMDILGGSLNFTSGEIKIFDKSFNKYNEAYIKSLIGYVPQGFGFCKDDKVTKCLEYTAILRKIYKDEHQRCIDKVINVLNLQPYKDEKYEELASSIKKRINLAQALLGEPKILIADDPFAGIDTEGKAEIRDIFVSYAKEGIVLFTTCEVSDILNICNMLIVLYEGRVLYRGTTENFINQVGGKIYECCTSDDSVYNTVKRKYMLTSSQCINNEWKVRIVSDILPNEIPCKEVTPIFEDAYMYTVKINNEAKVRDDGTT